MLKEDGIFGRNILKYENQCNQNRDFLIESLIVTDLKKKEFHEIKRHLIPQFLYSEHYWIAFQFLPILF